MIHFARNFLGRKTALCNTYSHDLTGEWEEVTCERCLAFRTASPLRIIKEKCRQCRRNDRHVGELCSTCHVLLKG